MTVIQRPSVYDWQIDCPSVWFLVWEPWCFLHLCIYYGISSSRILLQTPSYSSSWLGLWCAVWRAEPPGGLQEEEPTELGDECAASAHQGAAGPCGALYCPSDVENREAGPPITTALCIHTRPRRDALPVMATCPGLTHKYKHASRAKGPGSSADMIHGAIVWLTAAEACICVIVGC